MALHRLPVRRLPAALRHRWRSGSGARLVARALAHRLGGGWFGCGSRGPGTCHSRARRSSPPTTVVLRLGAAPVRPSPPVNALGKAEYADRRITRWLVCGAGMIPVRRQRPGDLAEALDQARRSLMRAAVLAVFPEGTRSRDGQLHHGHCGAAHLALQTGAPLIPVGIIGTDQILPVGARLVRPFRRATLRVGEPIWPATSGFTRQHESSPGGPSPTG